MPLQGFYQHVGSLTRPVRYISKTGREGRAVFCSVIVNVLLVYVSLFV